MRDVLLSLLANYEECRHGMSMDIAIKGDKNLRSQFVTLKTEKDYIEDNTQFAIKNFDRKTKKLLK